MSEPNGPEFEEDGADDPLTSLFNMLQGRMKKDMEQICFLDADDVKSWNELKAQSDKLMKDRNVLISKSKLFWASIELKYNVCGRTGLEVDESTTALMAHKEKK